MTKMRKVVALIVSLVMCISGIAIPSYAQNEINQRLEQAVINWNIQNKGTELEINEISEDLKKYVASLPGDVEFEVYKKDNVDLRKSAFRDLEVKKLSNEILPWHADIPAEQKHDAVIERIKQTDGLSFKNGTYTVNYTDTWATIFDNFLVGDPEKEANASKIIVDLLGKDNSLLYHSGMTETTSTSIQQYALWYKYRDRLTEEARDALYRCIVRMGTMTKGFTPYGASIMLHGNGYHNQGMVGFLLGVLYAEIANDSSMLRRMEAYIDRCLAEATMFGDFGDLSCSGYGGTTLSEMIFVYEFVEDSRLKAKLKILIDHYIASTTNLIHYPSNGFSFTQTRAYGCNYPAMVDKQQYITWFNYLFDGPFFAPVQDSMGYSYQFGDLASVTKYKIPKYIQDSFVNREYPYNISYKADSDTFWNEPTKSFNNYSTKNRLMYEKTSYMTEEYALSASPPQWCVPGNDGQNSVMRGTWRRVNDTKDIRDTSDIGVLYNMYLYDSDIERTPEYLSKEASYNVPNDKGKDFALQKDNKVVVMSYPGSVGDFDDPTYFYKVPLKQWSDMGASLMITNYEKIHGLWYGDTFLFGEETLLLTEDYEVKLRMSTTDLPIKLNGSDKFYVEDNNIYIAIQPLNSTNLGRECDMQLTAITQKLNERGFALRENALAITAYNYYGEMTTIPFEERIKQRNGFIIEFGEKSEYETIADFKKHISTTSFENYDEEDTWCVKYKSGEDTIDLKIDYKYPHMLDESSVNGKKVFAKYYTKTDEMFPMFNLVPDRNTSINYGEWNKMDFYDFLEYEPFANSEKMRTDSMVTTSEKEFTLGDATIKNPSGAGIFVMYEKTKKVYALYNMTAKTANFEIITPSGTVEINNMNLGQVVYKSQDEKNKIETNIVPRMTLLKTNVVLKGEE